MRLDSFNASSSLDYFFLQQQNSFSNISGMIISRAPRRPKKRAIHSIDVGYLLFLMASTMTNKRVPANMIAAAGPYGPVVRALIQNLIDDWQMKLPMNP